MMGQRIFCTIKEATHMEENRFTWNLEDIYPDEQVWYQDLSKAKELTAKLAAMQGKVCQDGHTLLEALDLSTKCSEYIAKLFTYASCHYDAQMGNAGYKKLYETICGENSAAAEQTSFLMPELMELTRESFDRLCVQVPELALYTHYIEDLLSQKEHILDERSEQMLVRMQDIHSSFKKIYTDLRVNDTKSEEIADSQGNKLVVSDATYSAAMEHPDRAFRKEFFEKLLGTYGGYINTLSSNYYALVKTNVYIAKSRRCRKTLSRRRSMTTCWQPFVPTPSRSSGISRCATGCWAWTRAICTTCSSQSCRTAPKSTALMKRMS